MTTAFFYELVRGPLSNRLSVMPGAGPVAIQQQMVPNLSQTSIFSAVFVLYNLISTAAIQ